MKLKQYDLHVYLKIDDYRRLTQEASSRNSSLSKAARDCLLEYLQLRQELATAIEEPGKVGDNHTGTIIHTLLARTEERIAATIEQQAERINELENHILTLTAMIDRMYLGIMQHLPEVPEELSKGSVASAKRRHNKWIEATEKILLDK